ncbi:MAG: peptidylprolyl isomerase [Solirubrobacterales bacterium]|jgi:cyclophilin family peptidyl-prolyl cis-trans isomerase
MLYSALILILAQAAAPPATPTPAPTPTPITGPVVEITTSLGVIKVALDAEKAPLSVDNFLKYVKAGFYDGTIFHRVMPNFMIQGGGMTPDLKEKPTRPAIRNEAKNGLRNSRGTIAMARLNEPNSATAQFFINVKDNHRLDFGIGGAGYAVFGAVVEGMDVVDKIVSVQTTSKSGYENVPVTAVLIKTAREVKGAAARPATPKAETPKAAPPTTPTPKPATPKPEPPKP